MTQRVIAAYRRHLDQSPGNEDPFSEVRSRILGLDNPEEDQIPSSAEYCQNLLNNLLTTSSLADFYVRLGPYEWKLHKAIICLCSTKLNDIISPNYSNPLTPVRPPAKSYELTNLRPFIFDLVVRSWYNGSYDIPEQQKLHHARLRQDHVSPIPFDDSQYEPLPVLLIHQKVYLALKKYREECGRRPVGEVLDAVEHVYGASPAGPGAEVFRKILVGAILRRFGEFGLPGVEVEERFADMAAGGRKGKLYAFARDFFHARNVMDCECAKRLPGCVRERES